ncbi:MAG: Ig-like domain-containing protein, partial [Phycisphaerae bacterium]
MPVRTGGPACSGVSFGAEQPEADKNVRAPITRAALTTGGRAKTSTPIIHWRLGVIAVILLGLVVVPSKAADFVIQNENFESGYIAGALSADPTGVTSGQGGWQTATAASSGTANWTIAADPVSGGTHGTVLATTAGTTAAGNNLTRYAWSDTITTRSTNNPVGNDNWQATYDFYVGGASATSLNRYGMYLYDVTGAKILAGVTVQNSTGQLYIVGNYNNAGNIANYSFTCGTTAILLRTNWYTLVVTFDRISGRFGGGYSTNHGISYVTFFVEGAAAGSSLAGTEMDLVASVNNGTALQGATIGYYDNINIVTKPSPSTTTLSSSLNPSTSGASVLFTATVVPAAATGTVTFKDGVTILGTGTLSGGTATYSTTALSLGS